MKGVLFGDKHSYKDWGLILAERPVITPPKVKTNYIDVPNANGSLDLTEILSDDVKYENREMTFKFIVLEDRKRWHEIYSNIQEYLHGQEMKIILDEDRSYYYTGRCSVDDWTSSKVTSTIVIKALVEPYKLELYSSLEEWQWDDFNFESGIVRNYKDIVVNGEHELIIEGTRLQVIPSFIVDGSMSVTFNGHTYQLPAGTSKILNIVIKQGVNTLKFIGNGKVSVDYRGGRL